MAAMRELGALRDALDPEPAHEPEPGDRAAAVLALIVFEPAPGLLFTQRAWAMSRHPGEVSFPGGLREPQDTSLVATALRETHEELGIDPAAPDVLGAMPPVHTYVSAILVTPVVAAMDRLPVLTLSHDEIARVFTLPLLALATSEDRHLLHRDERGEVRGWRYEVDDAIVWGATGAMVHELLDLIRKETPWMMS
jgi:8-oxo-dGTP pyrophosphatase MutT (NUDIX family)